MVHKKIAKLSVALKDLGLTVESNQINKVARESDRLPDSVDEEFAVKILIYQKNKIAKFINN
jgi:hypothetical protein